MREGLRDLSNSIRQTATLQGDGAPTLGDLRRLSRSVPDRATVILVTNPSGRWTLTAEWEEDASAWHTCTHGHMHPPGQTCRGGDAVTIAGRPRSGSTDYIGPYGSGTQFGDSH